MLIVLIIILIVLFLVCELYIFIFYIIIIGPDSSTIDFRNKCVWCCGGQAFPWYNFWVMLPIQNAVQYTYEQDKEKTVIIL